MTTQRILRRSWAGLPSGAPIHVCDVCRRDHRTLDDAQRCEREPLPDLPLEPGTRIRYTNRPTGETRQAEIIKRTFAMNGTWRAGEWQPHYREYTCRAREEAYDFLVHPDDIIQALSPSTGKGTG